MSSTTEHVSILHPPTSAGGPPEIPADGAQTKLCPAIVMEALNEVYDELDRLKEERDVAYTAARDTVASLGEKDTSYWASYLMPPS